MKTNRERLLGVRGKLVEKKRKRRKLLNRIALGVGVAGLTAINLVLFLPYSAPPVPDITQYQNSEYYSLIKKVHTATYVPPKTYKNNFDKWTSGLKKYDIFNGVGAAPNGMATTPKNDNSNYVETTDNQVSGVIEGDLFKRTREHLFYLQRDGGAYHVRVYSIDGEESCLVNGYKVKPVENASFMGDAEMYLSEDGTTVTIVAKSLVTMPNTQKNHTKSYTTFISLDVSDPLDIKETQRTYLSGWYESSRLIDGNFLVVGAYTVLGYPDFSNEATFLPQYGAWGDMRSLPAENIIMPETLTTARYSFAYAIDEKTLEATDSVAFLSSADTVYVSKDNVFVARGYTAQNELGDGEKEWATMTEISRVSYADGELTYENKTSVAGSVKNQYSMDEYEGILRVVATTSRTVREERDNGDTVSVSLKERTGNVNLYCLNISDFSVRASVEAFAPEYETAESVRFAGDTAYVCTAEITYEQQFVTITDPVYAFDLSDLDNITYKDTGTIEGYSTSLVDFGEGYVLGIGYGESFSDFKIEAYAETETGVVSVAEYDAFDSWTDDYKAYYIDREHRYFGAGTSNGYQLLAFDGNGFEMISYVMIKGDMQTKRAVIIDGYLYVLSEQETGFKVVKI